MHHIACTAGADTNEIPAPNHESMREYTHKLSLHATSPQHYSYTANESNINNGNSYNRATVRRLYGL